MPDHRPLFEGLEPRLMLTTLFGGEVFQLRLGVGRVEDRLGLLDLLQKAGVSAVRLDDPGESGMFLGRGHHAGRVGRHGRIVHLGGKLIEPLRGRVQLGAQVRLER